MTDEASALAVLALPPGSRVRVFGGADDRLAARLAERDCTVATDGVEAAGGIDAAVLLGTLDAAHDAVGVLQEASAAVGTGGLVVASVPRGCQTWYWRWTRMARSSCSMLPPPFQRWSMTIASLWRYSRSSFSKRLRLGAFIDWMWT